MEKININNRYISDEAIRIDSSPYLAYGNCLIETFKNVKSFCDVGCATGHLISYINNMCDAKVKGYEYFSYHKE